MDFVLKNLNVILKKIQFLKHKIRTLEAENIQLKKENDLLKSEAESLKRQLDTRLKDKVGDLFAAEFVGRFRTRDEARKKIDELLATVDKILTRIKYGQ